MSDKTNVYQNWLSKADISLEHQKNEPTGELARAEPDLLAAPEPQIPEELQAAIEVIQEGALKKLIPTQQKIFQMSIIEGEKDKAVMAKLGLDRAAFKYHLKQIGLVLRKQCEKKLERL